jgi:ribokinase
MIIVFGSINLDQIGAVSRLPRPGETVAGSGFAVAPGGKGANQALAACRAGGRVRHVGAVGDDPFAAAALALLKADGVDLSGVRVAAATATGIAMILVDAAGENVIAVLPGANGTVGPADADRALAEAKPGDVLLLQQEIPQAATARALALARDRGVLGILNTAPILADTAAVAPLAAVLVANETEFAMLSGCDPDDPAAAAVDWAARHHQTVVVTRGGAGALAVADGRLIAVAAPAIRPVDTVGAGDTFCGYLAAGLAAGEALEPALRRAVAAASLACLAPGAQPAIPWRAAVDAAAS